jgi:hypothetical protein
MTEAEKITEFSRLVRAHDITYSYSDDIRVWRKGDAEWHAIAALLQEIPRAMAVRIWNNEVTRRFGERGKEYFWRE